MEFEVEKIYEIKKDIQIIANYVKKKIKTKNTGEKRLMTKNSRRNM